MLSTDPLFYIFAAGIFIGFYLAGTARLQTAVLALGSLVMYATEGLQFLLLLIASSALTASCSFLAATCSRRCAALAVLAGVAVNLGVLSLFKYQGLLVPYGTIPDESWLGGLLRLGLPIGI